MAIKVKNIKGTSDNKCNCDSWMDHWEIETGKTAYKCIIKDCPNEAKHGGHVKRVDIDSNKWYIIPLCPSHNNWKKEDEEELKDWVKSAHLAKANTNETCSK